MLHIWTALGSENPHQWENRITYIHFEFENEQGVYIPGQAVRGRLHVTLSQATNVRGK